MTSNTPYQVYSGQIEPELLDAIESICNRQRLMKGTVGAGQGDLNESYRNSDIAFLPEGHWTMGLLYHFAAVANAQAWRYDIAAPSPVQLTRYGAGQFYNWHRDSGGEPPQARMVRKISVILQLSDPSTYEGGTVEFKLGEETDEPRIVPALEAKSRGSVIVFPSWLPHRVTEVTNGERRSLVNWVVGPPFR